MVLRRVLLENCSHEHVARPGYPELAETSEFINLGTSRGGPANSGDMTLRLRL